MEEQIEIAKNFTYDLIKHMGFESEISTSKKNGEIYIDIKTEKVGRLIGKNGNTLDSLQFLINKMVNKKLKSSVRLVLDINRYRKRREEQLKKLASQWSETAKKKNKEITIGPFNTFERRIIHTALKKDSLIKTESIGNGDTKKIKIIPLKKNVI